MSTDLGHTLAPDELCPGNSVPSPLEQRQSLLERHGNDGCNLVGMEHVGIERQIGAHREDLLDLVVQASRPVREAAPEPHEVSRATSSPISSSASRTASASVSPARRCPPTATSRAPGHVSFDGERRWKSANGPFSSTPPTQMWSAPCQSPSRWTSPRAFCTPVGRPESSRTSKGSSCGSVIGRASLRASRRAFGSTTQKRSSTFSSAPSAISCSVSSLRPGLTSRWTVPSSPSRY